MHIIYHCVGGTHSSAIASAIHLGLLPKTRAATVQELLSIPYFDNTDKQEYGRIIHRGIDEYGNNIYTLSRQFTGSIMIRALKDLCIILTGSENHVIFINASTAVNNTMKIGGFLSRRLNMIAIGRPIVLKGCSKAYMDIAAIVTKTKENVRQMRNS